MEKKPFDYKDWGHKFTVALVKSLACRKNGYGDKIEYKVEREGKPKRAGGNGVRWFCTCPAYKFGHGRPCKHMVLVFGMLRTGEKGNDLVTLTTAGLAFVKEGE